MKFLLMIFLTLTPPQPSPKIYTVPGATVYADTACANGHSAVSYALTANDGETGAYRLTGLSAYPHISLLSTHAGQASLDGETLRWHWRSVGDEVVVVGAQRAGCWSEAGAVVSLGRVFLPVVIK